MSDSPSVTLSASPNETGSAPLLADPAFSPCPLEGIPQPLHEYVHRLEARIVVLEAEQKRFTDALVNAGEFLFKNPASKMMLAAFPKEMQTKLKDFFDARK